MELIQVETDYLGASVEMDFDSFYQAYPFYINNVTVVKKALESTKLTVSKIAQYDKVKGDGLLNVLAKL